MKTYEMREVMRSFRTILPCLASISLFVGCSDSVTDESGGKETGPLYVITALHFSPDLSSRTDVLQFSDSLNADAKIDKTKTIELTGLNPTTWASYKEGEFFLADASGKVLRYALDDNGKLQQTQTMSLSAYGVNAFYNAMIIVWSETKAFLFDEITLQGFIWNPSDMTITRKMDLKSLFNTSEGGRTFSPWRERSQHKIGNKYFGTYIYFDKGPSETIQRSGMMVFDSDSETLTTVEQDKCPGIFNSVIGTDGKFYSATGTNAAAGYYLKHPGIGAPCLVRFDPDKMAFDDTFNVDIGSLVGGKIGAMLLGMDGQAAAYIRVLNEDLVASVTKSVVPIATFSAWDHYKLDSLIDPKTATKVDSMPTSAGGPTTSFTVDGKAYVMEGSFKDNKSWFLDLSADPPKRTMEIPGYGTYCLRIR